MCYLCLLPALLPSLARAEMSTSISPEPSLRRYETGYFPPLPVLRIDNAEVKAMRRESFAVELDDLDVTALAIWEDGGLILRPAQVLAPGWHTLRLVEVAPDGEILERGFWRFEVRRSAWWREVAGQAQVNLSLSRRLAGSRSNGVRSSLAGGSARLEGRADNGRWRLAGNTEMVYQPDDDLRGEAMWPLDIAVVNAAARSDMVALEAGDQAPVAPGLIVEDQYLRRGVSAGWRYRDDLAGVTVFALRSQKTEGLKGGVGLSSPDERLIGFTISGRPQVNRGSELYLALTWLGGRDPGQVGAGVAGDPDFAAVGRAQAFSLDGQWWERRLRLRGEWARSRLDFDGEGPLSAEEAGAYSLLSSFTPARSFELGRQAVSWSAGVELRRLDSFFYSLANPGAGADRAGWRAFFSAARGGFSAEAMLGREHDNVDGLPGLPRVGQRRVGVTMAWNPVDKILPAWLGEPSLSLELRRNRQTVERAGGGLVKGGLRHTRTLVLGARFNYGRGAWGWVYSQADDDDLALDLSTVSRSHEFTLFHQALAQLSLDLVFQRERYRDRERIISDTADLVVDYQPLRRLGLRLTLAAEEQSGSFEGVSRATTATALVRWQWLQSAVWSLEGMRYRNRYVGAPLLRDDRLFLRLDLEWP